MASTTNITRDWCGLPAHLIGRIMDRLSVSDYIRCRAVCTSWLLAATEEVPHGPTISVAQSPFLLFPGGDLSDDFAAEFRTLVSPFSDPQKTYHLHLPQIRGRRLLGSSNGWLVTADDNAELHLLNPLTGSYSPLPSLTTLSAITGPACDNNTGCIIGYYVKEEGYPDKLRDMEYFQNFFYSKVVVFSSTSSLIVTFIIQHEWQVLAFARPGDESWTEIDPYPPHCGFFDIILHKGYFYGVRSAGMVVAFDINTSPEPKIIFVSPYCNGHFVHKYYLVESLDGTELMQIWRHEKSVLPEDQEYDGVPNLETGTVYRTIGFQVFKFDSNGHEWIELKDLPEATALFLGDNQSEALSTQDLPELKRNCIYFTDGDREQYNSTPRARRDVGVFDLTDGTIRPLFPRNSFLHRLTWPPPIWFTPRLL